MARSTKRSIAIANPLLDVLEHQLKSGVLDYPSVNAAINGLLLYQGLTGKPHDITSRIAYMHRDHQDVIHDFTLEMNRRGVSLMGSFIRHVAERVAAGEAEPDPDTIVKMQADHVLELALRWQRGDEDVWSEIG